MARAELVSRLALAHCFEPADEQVGAAVAEFGAERLTRALSDTGDSRPTLVHLRRRWRFETAVADADREIGVAAEHAVSIIGPRDAVWPTALADLDDRQPLLLWQRGLDLSRSSRQVRVAVVGSRAATRYGMWVAEELGACLADAGCCVVSGGAFGIDAAAHRGVLAAGGHPILVTAGGVDLSVPLGNDQLFRKVAQFGTVISETPLGRPPSRHRFLIRNRIIAALAHIVVVVEAASRSGALATAREADCLSRYIAAVPGPITSEASKGTNALIASGTARLITSLDGLSDWFRPVANQG